MRRNNQKVLYGQPERMPLLCTCAFDDEIMIPPNFLITALAVGPRRTANRNSPDVSDCVREKGMRFISSFQCCYPNSVSIQIVSVNVSRAPKNMQSTALLPENNVQGKLNPTFPASGRAKDCKNYCASSAIRGGAKKGKISVRSSRMIPV